MRNSILSLVCASLLAVPFEAAAAQSDVRDVQTGVFVGARFHIAFGGKSAPQPRAALALAPTLTRVSDHAGVQTRIGDGIALSLNSRPSLSLAGVRADRALAVNPSTEIDPKRKLGLSKGGWIALGLGVVAIGGGLYFLHFVDEADDNSD